MNAKRKDWELTQYALGEMSDRDKAKFEKQFSGNAEVQEEIEEIRAFGSLLSSELRREAAPELTEEQRRGIADRWARQPRRRGFGWKLTWGLAPIAAGLIGLLSVHLAKKELPNVTGTKFVPPKLDELMTEPSDPTSDGEAERVVEEKPQAVVPKPTGPLNKKPSMNFGVGGAIRGKMAPGSPAQPSTGAPRARFYDMRGGAPVPQYEAADEAAPTDDLTASSTARAEPKMDRARRAAAPSKAKKGAIKSLEVEKDKEFNTEAYDSITDNVFHNVSDESLSTFSADVDTASYANLRRFITGGGLPPKDAVRIEEMVNYFPYSYAPPTDKSPFAVHVEVNTAPWQPEHRLVRIGLKSKEIDWSKRAPSNLVFLLDVSGSMNEPNKLPLVKNAMKLLVDKLGESDRVAIAVYAGSSGLVLPPTKGSDKKAILEALEKLEAGGSTNGAQGIELAYKTAKEGFRKGGINRVILATDGDFNVGVTSQGDLTRLIEAKAKEGVFLTVLGFGMGNYKDSTMEKLADKGNGNYAYIDTMNEAKKVFVQEIGGTMVTVAKDVKLQVEFNPAQVDSFRLIGYENRILEHRDFNDDKKDAGDIGAGHTVTALYEVVPKGKGTGKSEVDGLRYQKTKEPSSSAGSGELMTLKIRYKDPEASTSQLLQYPVTDAGKGLIDATPDFKFAAGVAAFGMILRDSPHKGKSTIGLVLDLASPNKGTDPNGHRSEFIGLVEKAKPLLKK